MNISEGAEKPDNLAEAPHVLVTAANGRTGRAIVGALVGRGCVVSALVHNSDHVEGMIRLGATRAVAGDLLDSDSIASAIGTADTVVHIGPPMHPQEVTMTGNVAEAMRQAGAGRLLYYSVMHPLRTEVRHHRLKLESEALVVESGLAYTIVQPIRYMQHLESIWATVLATGLHAMPFDTSVRFNIVDLNDIAEAVARIAGEPGHEYASYELAGPESLSQTDMAAIIGTVIDMPVRAGRIDPVDAAQKALAAGASQDRSEQIQVMNTHYDQHGFLGNPNVLTWLLGRPPTTFRQYVQRLSVAAAR